ncbi:MAG: ZIP family metal transporter [Spirochaetia bacterium]
MSLLRLYVLGALAGLTIFLGLPIAAFSRLKPEARGVMNGLATGILIFLTIDILSNVLDSGEQVIKYWADGQAVTFAGVLTLVLLVLGVFAGLIGIPLIEKRFIKPAMQRGLPRRAAAIDTSAAAGGTRAPAAPAAGKAVDTPTTPPAVLSLSIAAGIGLHNLGEGLAIGQSAASGAVSLALVLVIGFGLHNMTEGFGIAAPLAGMRPSLRFLLLAGLIGGGPTFIGTIIGASWSSPVATTLFLSIAGGSLIYVSADLLILGRRSLARLPLMISVAAGFFIGYFTELLAALSIGS